ncbi:uncharacterized protein LOC101850800 [Aplysia californica]|uniref:Uncharacterized protein LOC101850800 n=1 Tax=Aplysia californica TaxID=6500 RepID=A0ABM0JN60_APLCA|nr:uncharacterized protein LOC101850800 [Aplysia californica]
MEQGGKLPDITEYTDRYIKYPYQARAHETKKSEEPAAESLPNLEFWPKTYEDALKILEPTRAKGVKFPGDSEYVDKYVPPSEMSPKPDPHAHLENVKVDMLTGRPRTPNDPYTVLTQQQLKNMKQDSAPFFMKEDLNAGPGSRNGPVIRPAPIDRYATNTSQFLFRDNPPKTHPHCWVDDQWKRDPPADHNTCRLGASLRWGPQKTGQRTIDHFHKEDVHRYLNIDVYKRNPTNVPSMVVMKHGRPSEGYYQQRNPNFNTWFGSTHQLNETNVLTTIRPKTYAEYAQVKAMEQDYNRHKAAQWPEISEYTDKFLLNSKVPVELNDMETKKQFHREKRRREAEATLQAQSLATQQQATTTKREAIPA